MIVVRSLLFAVCAASALALSAPVSADFDAPVKKKVDCTKPENKTKPACKPKHGATSTDEIYNAGYWMARQGQYAGALAVFRMAPDQDDPRILTGIGFTTRKLGNVDAALPYYAAALNRDPDLVLTRAYLGEAHLQRGDLAAARAELGEIARRCGTACEAHVQLSREIATYKAAALNKG